MASQEANRTGILKEFRRGLLSPSLPALIGIILITLALYAVCLLAVTPALLAAIPAGYLMDNPDDDYAQLTNKILRIAQGSAPEVDVAVFGSSATREAILSAGDLSERVSAILGQPVSVQVFAAGALYHYETLAALDCMGRKIRRLVVIEVSPRQLCLDADWAGNLVARPRLAIVSRRVDDYAKRIGLASPRRTGNFFWDNRHFFFARWKALSNVVLGPRKELFHHTELWRPLSDSEMKRALVSRRAWQSQYASNRERNLALYHELVTYVRSDLHLTPVLLEMVVNEHLEPLIYDTPDRQRILAEYRADVQQLADELHTPYWNLTDSAHVEPTDFQDTSHINTREGRVKYTEVLAQAVAEQLRNGA